VRYVFRTLRRDVRLLFIALAALVALVLSSCSGSSDTGTSGSVPSPAPHAESAPDAEPAPQGDPVPEELVGRWNGGSDEQGHWYYEFQSDGSYSAWPAYEDNPTVITGTIEVTSSQLTFSNGGNPFTVEWYVSGGLLFMDGYSSVPA
jgi:hypothetical protein